MAKKFFTSISLNVAWFVDFVSFCGATAQHQKQAVEWHTKISNEGEGKLGQIDHRARFPVDKQKTAAEHLTAMRCPVGQCCSERRFHQRAGFMNFIACSISIIVKNRIKKNCKQKKRNKIMTSGKKKPLNNEGGIKRAAPQQGEWESPFARNSRRNEYHNYFFSLHQFRF